MVIRFYCGCGRRLTAPDGTSGRHAKCPMCGARVLIPEKPSEEDIPMAVPQKPAQEVIFDEPAPVGAVPPPPAAAPPPPPLRAQEPVISGWLTLSARIGVVSALVTGLIACVTTAWESIAQQAYAGLVVLPLQLLVLFLILAVLGYLCSAGGIRRLGQLPGHLREKTVPPAMSLLSLIVALTFLWFCTIDLVAQPAPDYANAISSLGMCLTFILIALIWRSPRQLGTSVRDETMPGKWSFLDAIISLIELGAKVTAAGGIVLFGVAGVFLTLSILVGMILALTSHVDAATAVISRLPYAGIVAVAPLAGYLTLLFTYGVTHTIRVLIAAERNTRKLAGR